MPSSAILGKTATAYVLNGMRIPHVLDIGAGCGTYKRLLAPYLPGARWTGVEVWAPYVEQYGLRALYDELHIADATTFDFASLPEGGLVLFGDVLEHIQTWQVCEMVNAAMERCDIGVLSLPLGEWPQDAWGGNPHEVHVASWYADDIGRRFAPTLAGMVDHKVTESHSVAVVFLGRTEEIRTALAAKIEAFHQELARDPGLDYCGLDFCPDYQDSRIVARFHGRMRSLLSLPSLFSAQFEELCRFLEIRSLADAGCGDFGWMQPLSQNFSLYLGIDRDPALITDLDYRFGGLRGHFFSCRDVAVHPLPAVDAILCRDLFSGQSVEAVQAILANIRASGSRYMMASTTPGAPPPLDLGAAPFNLPLPLIQFEDEASPGRIMGVWQIPAP